MEKGPLYFGVDNASQQSLTKLLQHLVSTYHLQGKDLFLGGFSIGGSCAVKYAELALQHNYAIKPKAVFAVDPPLDLERFYTNAKRVARLAKGKAPNGEVSYMIEQIEKEMKGSPQVALASYHTLSPYSYSDTYDQRVTVARQSASDLSNDYEQRVSPAGSSTSSPFVEYCRCGRPNAVVVGPIGMSRPSERNAWAFVR